MDKKRWTAYVLLVLLLSAIGIFLPGCDDEDKPVWHYKVYRENLNDDTNTMWIMQEKPEMDEGFLCWEKDGGGEFCISGKITIDTYQVGAK